MVSKVQISSEFTEEPIKSRVLGTGSVGLGWDSRIYISITFQDDEAASPGTPLCKCQAQKNRSHLDRSTHPRILLHIHIVYEFRGIDSFHWWFTWGKICSRTLRIPHGCYFETAGAPHSHSSFSVITRSILHALQINRFLLQLAWVPALLEEIKYCKTWVLYSESLTFSEEDCWTHSRSCPHSLKIPTSRCCRLWGTSFQILWYICPLYSKPSIETPF